jgi:hypothetical protein
MASKKLFDILLLTKTPLSSSDSDVDDSSKSIEIILNLH